MPYKLATIRVATSIDLVKAGEALGNAWFRGQGSARWGLQSTLERDAMRFGVPRKHLHEREEVMLRLFKERAHLHSLGVNFPQSRFEWHALIRHYGGPSRLLDVTSSYLVAAYFALSDSQPNINAAVWAFTEHVGNSGPATELDSKFELPSNPGVTVAKPDQLNVRMSAQSGSFFVPGSVEVSLEEQISKAYDINLHEVSKYRSAERIKTEIGHRIWKLVIPHAAHSELLRFVSRCNVRAYSLFPGIEGLCLSLREMMRAHN